MATIRKRGHLQWEARIRRKGYPVQCATFESRASAEAWARQIESAMDGGTFVSQKEAERTTVSEALERYIHEYIEKTLAHADKEVTRARRLMKYPFAQKKMAALRGTDLAAYVAEREKQGRAANTIDRDLGLLSRMYEVARANWGMEGLQNPVRNVIRPKLPQGRTRRLRPGEEEALLEAAPSSFRPLFLFALETAMRRDELVNLCWEHVDMERRTAFLPKTKNGEARTVPLSPAALTILEALREEIPGACKGQVFGYTLNSVTGTMRSLCAKIGIEDLHFHDLRHEAISRLFERTDLDLMEIRMISGHKTLAMLARYTHLRADRLADRLAGMRRGTVPERED